jgi:hypothetical protein
MAETIATSLYAPRMGAMLLTVFGAEDCAQTHQRKDRPYAR